MGWYGDGTGMGWGWGWVFGFLVIVGPVWSTHDLRGVRHPRVVRGRRVPEVLMRVHPHRQGTTLVDFHAEILCDRAPGVRRAIIASADPSPAHRSARMKMR